MKLSIGNELFLAAERPQRPDEGVEPEGFLAFLVFLAFFGLVSPFSTFLTLLTILTLFKPLDSF